MAFSDYTSPDSVRAVLGISAKEISDDKVTDPVYLTTLLEALYALNPALAADFAAARDASSRSVKQTRFVLLVETVCAYVVAIALIPALPLAAPQIITDGKTALNRIANPYEMLRPDLIASLAYLKTNLMAAYTDLNAAIPAVVAKARTMVMNVGLAVDPVTGA